MTIKIQIQGKDVELSPEEARRIHDELSKVYGSPATITWPNLVPVPYNPNPWTQPQDQPFNPWTWPQSPVTNPHITWCHNGAVLKEVG